MQPYLARSDICRYVKHFCMFAPQDTIAKVITNVSLVEDKIVRKSPEGTGSCFESRRTGLYYINP